MSQATLSAQCTAEILIEASKRIGRPIHKHGYWDRMNIADAIADVCVNNAQGALDAFAALHKATGSANLKAWQSGRYESEVVAMMRETARKVAV